MSENGSAEVIVTHQDAVWRYLRLLGCDAVEADDLAQETFVVFLSKPFAPVNDAATFVYLRNTARLVFLNHMRKTRRDRNAKELSEADVVWDRYEMDGGEAHLEALKVCLERLPERLRAVLEMQYRDQASGKEIAATLAISLANVKNLAHRATTFLRECISERMSRG